ncbi:alpha/beta hydrolase [Spirulina sp. CS-785/01]|uniref:alpha/beta hydrolase n=1 Tax=Spirulina sp. CS-785/01 TaxID=3021716 RepID=UPI00232C7BEB|nr:alpha/beta hydrolase [Spirulina sp. CS-785/01]MDB9312641.1 alpha/beta hydrolase [Spirulina sp. CS-785/01]
MSSILSTSLWKKQWNRAKTLTQAAIIGTGAGLLCWGGGVNATEVINVRYNEFETTVTTDILVDFARNGDIGPELEDLLLEIGEIGAEVPDILQDALTTEIRLRPDFIQNLLGSSIGEFVVVQIERAINTGQVEEDVAYLKDTIEESIEDDNRVSILELVERYPVETVNLDLSSLQSIYEGAVNFIDGLQPTLSVVLDFLEGAICDCPAPTADEMDSEMDSDLQSSATTDKNCPTNLTVTDENLGETTLTVEETAQGVKSITVKNVK